MRLGNTGRGRGQTFSKRGGGRSGKWEAGCGWMLPCLCERSSGVPMKIPSERVPELSALCKRKKISMCFKLRDKYTRYLEMCSYWVTSLHFFLGLTLISSAKTIIKKITLFGRYVKILRLIDDSTSHNLVYRYVNILLLFFSNHDST